MAFLTVVGRSRAPGPRTLDWFPFVGAAMGLTLGGFWWAVGRGFPPLVAAALVVGADLAVTGMLHLDGVVDAADGLLPPLDPARRLEVMAAPDAGAFGVGAAAILLILRWAALTAIRPGILLLGGLWCLSRTFAAAVARTQPYARPGGGLPDAFAGPARWAVTVAGLAGGAALVAGWKVGPGLAAAGSGLVAGAGVVALARRRIGGYTGDVLGAGVFVAETMGLVVAAARW
ncbi:MAG TPA: adenosylcobinamide-GDP ribazoletransferase [Acidimicrobiales bacterium]|nr:adenosylcobinamide-GDP ribazoletransferase [Acidimicrobiales bacterium]